MGVAGEEFNWDDLGRRLSRPVSKWDKQFRPVDWDKEEWTNALADTDDVIDLERPETRPQCPHCGQTFIDGHAFDNHQKHSTRCKGATK